MDVPIPCKECGYVRLAGPLKWGKECLGCAVLKLQENQEDLRADVDRIDSDIEPDHFGRRPWDNVG